MLLRDAKLAEDYKLVESAWLGKIFNSLHGFAVEHIGPTGFKSWVFPLHHFPDSSVLALPLDIHPVPGTTQHYFNISKPGEPKLISVFKLPKGTGRACMVETHSPYWQAINASPYIKALQPQIRLWKVGSYKPLSQLAPENAFWLMPRSDVADFSAYWGHPVVGASNLFETLMSAVQGLLGCSTDDALNYVHVRIALMSSLTRYSKELDHKVIS